MPEIIVRWRKQRTGPIYGGPAFTAAFVLPLPKLDGEYDEAVGEGEHVIYLECEQPDAESYQGNPWGVRWRQGQCV